ncbi:MAG: hypothetical protein ACI4JF_10350 [Oscillospiraceae bacterium]
MNSKEFLLSYTLARKRIRLNREKLRRCEEFVGSGERSCAESAVSEYEDKLWLENERLSSLAFEAERTVKLGGFTETERELAERRYFLGQKWEDIAEEMCYSVQHLHSINRALLAKLTVPVRYAHISFSDVCNGE